MQAIVVQFGLAMIFLGITSRSSGLTSDTTSGTSLSIRQHDELSTTKAPASAKRGAHICEVLLPAEKMAISIPDRSAVSTSSTVILWPSKLILCPADRADAIKRSVFTGKSREARICRITMPTCPVAPKTARSTPWLCTWVYICPVCGTTMPPRSFLPHLLLPSLSSLLPLPSLSPSRTCIHNCLGAF